MGRVLKLTLAYDGTEFAGWQRQARERTVQGVLEDALAPIATRQVSVVGAGRTDAGVHAAGQVASVSMPGAIPCDELRRALNATLPEDVRVLAIEEAVGGFNARSGACRKTYRYWIWNGEVMPPLLRRYVWHVPQPLDLTAISEAAASLTGEHDFAAFQGAGSHVKTTTRHIVSSTIDDIGVVAMIPGAVRGCLFGYAVTGTGFLRHMIRNIAGTLVDVGRGRRASGDIAAILASRDRRQASATAPPHGLILWSVEY